MSIMKTSGSVYLIKERMTIIKDFIIKEIVKQRSFTQELNTTTNLSRVKTEDNPYMNSIPIKHISSKKNTPKSRTKILNVEKEILTNPVSSKETL